MKGIFERHIPPPVIIIFNHFMYILPEFLHIYIYVSYKNVKYDHAVLAIYFLHLMSYLLSEVINMDLPCLFMCFHNTPLYWYAVMYVTSPFWNLVSFMGRFILPQFFLASCRQVCILWPWLSMTDVCTTLLILKF